MIEPSINIPIMQGRGVRNTSYFHILVRAIFSVQLSGILEQILHTTLIIYWISAIFTPLGISHSSGINES